MKKTISLLLLLLSCHAITSYAEQAKSWVLNNAESKIAYGSIKKNTVGESNYFSSLTGYILPSGEVHVDIDLSSVQTNIDIRNTRMIKHVFGEQKTTAKLQAKVNLDEINALKPGMTMTLDVEGRLLFLGRETAIETSFFVARLADKRLMVTTDEMIMLKTKDIGVDSGIDILQGLAKLPGITRVAPVTLRLMFDHGDAPSNQTIGTLSADSDAAKAGKKVYKMCRACHMINKPTNVVGPHLVGIVGRKAGSIGNFKNYSKALSSADINWTPENLTQFLRDPKGFLPGNGMYFRGIKKEEDIKNLIAYLQSAGR